MSTLIAKRRIHVPGILLTLLLAVLLAAACGQPETTPDDVNEPEEDTAAAVLEAYRNFGGEIQELSATNPTLTSEVDDLQGTVPAYDLTGGNPPCTGFVRAVPSLVFTLGADASAVKVAFAGNALSTLIVVAEGEEIVCDPAASPVLKPEMMLETPKAGRYGVWIGRADNQVTLDGALTVTLEP